MIRPNKSKGAKVAQEVVPSKQNVTQALKGRKYDIDFYQREYVWSKNTADALLNDIFYVFELGYNQHKDSEISQKVIEKYSWYYLNVYITNKVDSKIYIVDGQQRLTTLTLIALKLYHLVKKEQIKEALKPCIFSSDSFGSHFNMDNDKRKDVMDALLHNKEYKQEYKNDTERNLIARYKDISQYLESRLNESKKLESFCHYFLLKLVLVELDISQDDTPMVFESINDRGEKLKPFEILKGKLIGALNKNDVEAFVNIWNEAMRELSGVEDRFFSDYLKSKFIFIRNSEKEKQINNLYHRYIFESNEIANALGLRKTDSNQKKNIKNFIKQDISYYSKLYAKILKSNNEFLRYCKEIHDLDGQYRLIMAACKIDDREENEKIEIIAKEYERLWILLNLNRIYDSNEFQEISYNLHKELAEANISDYRKIFNDTLLKAIETRKSLDKVDSMLPFSTFVSLGYYDNLKPRFLRYLFARVEKYICENIRQTPQHDVFYISNQGGDVIGYHIEHILSKNDTNVSYFDNEEEFEAQRNKLGGLLLLKGKNNISSNNEEYKDKLKTYSNSLVWGHTLCDDFYHSNVDFTNFNNELETKFKPYDKFDKSALQERTKLLYELVKNIWEVQ